MYIKIITIFVGVAFLTSCGKSLTPAKTVAEEQDINKPLSDIEITELQANSSHLGNNNQNWNEIVDNAEASEEFRVLDGLYNEFFFGEGDILKGSNSLYVSNATEYNPLQGKDYLCFDLKKLGKSFCYPLPEGKFISNYGMRSGRMHSGVDIKAPKNTKVLAAFDGVVRMSRNYSAYGNLVVVRHYNGLETVYAHNNKNLVKVGDEVSKGEVIAKVGRTGRATTEHIHFEVRIAGQYVDPNTLIDVHNNTIQKGDLYIYKKGTRIYASNAIPEHIAYSQKIKSEGEFSEKETKKESKKETKDNKKDKVVYHTIVKGNTLYSLAKKYGTTVQDICKLNKNLKPTSTLSLNQKIRVK
ncbi:MAG: M23 family metallopeptidase [Rikenellaceae bacterium]